MKKIFGIWLLLICLVGSVESFGQSFSTELTGLEESWSLSGSFSTVLSKSSKFSFSNVSRISADYLGKEELHALLISNLAYSLHRRFKSTLGGIYSNGGGLIPTVGIQYLDKKGRLNWMAFPNLKVQRVADVMILSMLQYSCKITEKSQYVFRIQSLGLFNSQEHLFSTFRFRTGFIRGKYQFGAASDFNFAGNNFECAPHFGMFFQYQII